MTAPATKRRRSYAPGELDPTKLPLRIGRMEAAYLCGMSPDLFDRYWNTHTDLRAAHRVLRDPNKPDSKGVSRWLTSAVKRHAEGTSGR